MPRALSKLTIRIRDFRSRRTSIVDDTMLAEPVSLPRRPSVAMYVFVVGELDMLLLLLLGREKLCRG